MSDRVFNVKKMLFMTRAIRDHYDSVYKCLPKVSTFYFIFNNHNACVICTT